MRILVACILLALALAEAPTPPVWPNQFTMEFNETSRIIVAGITKGIWYYDAANNRHVIERKDGRHNRYCDSVFYQQSTPCRQIVVASKQIIIQTRDGWTSLKRSTAASAAIAPRVAESLSQTGL
jgi:hypothetical protein